MESATAILGPIADAVSTLILLNIEAELHQAPIPDLRDVAERVAHHIDALIQTTQPIQEEMAADVQETKGEKASLSYQQALADSCRGVQQAGLLLRETSTLLHQQPLAKEGRDALVEHARDLLRHTSVILDTVDLFSVYRVREACLATKERLQEHKRYRTPEDLAAGIPQLSTALSLLLGFATARSEELIHATHTECILASIEEIKGAMPSLLEAMKAVILHHRSHPGEEEHKTHLLRDTIIARLMTAIDRIDEIVQLREKTEYAIKDYRDVAIARQAFYDALQTYEVEHASANASPQQLEQLVQLTLPIIAHAKQAMQLVSPTEAGMIGSALATFEEATRPQQGHLDAHHLKQTERALTFAVNSHLHQALLQVLPDTVERTAADHLFEQSQKAFAIVDVLGSNARTPVHAVTWARPRLAAIAEEASLAEEDSAAYKNVTGEWQQTANTLRKSLQKYGAFRASELLGATKHHLAKLVREADGKSPEEQQRRFTSLLSRIEEIAEEEMANTENEDYSANVLAQMNTLRQGLFHSIAAREGINMMAMNNLRQGIKALQRLTMIEEGDEEDLEWFDALESPGSLSKPMSKSNSRQFLVDQDQYQPDVLVVNEEAPRPLTSEEAKANPVKAAAADLHVSASQWSTSDNIIISTCQQLSVALVALSSFYHLRDPMPDSKKQLIASAQEISRLLVALTQHVTALIQRCPDKRLKKQLQDSVHRLVLLAQQIKILSAVKAGSPSDKDSEEQLASVARNIVSEVEGKLLRGCEAAELAARPKGSDAVQGLRFRRQIFIGGAKPALKKAGSQDIKSASPIKTTTR